MTTATETKNGQGAEAVGAAPTAPAPEPTAWQRLREPFPPEKIGKLPPRGGVELSFVGHADVTDRLLAVDPAWEWEPVARVVDPDLLKVALATGNPEMVEAYLQLCPPELERNAQGKPVGLWITLTVAGVQRLGFGSVKPDAFDAEKQLIGDALRNAAMRFGVALDLWRKEETHPAEPRRATAAAVRASTAAPVTNGVAVSEAFGEDGTARDALLHAILAMPASSAKITILSSFGYQSSMTIVQWISKLDDDVVAKVAAAIAPGGGDVDPDSIPF